jgi:hypothetical protein
LATATAISPPKPLRVFPSPPQRCSGNCATSTTRFPMPSIGEKAIRGLAELDVEWCNINNLHLLPSRAAFANLKEYGLIIVSHAAAVTI